MIKRLRIILNQPEYIYSLISFKICKGLVWLLERSNTHCNYLTSKDYYFKFGEK